MTASSTSINLLSPVTSSESTVTLVPSEASSTSLTSLSNYLTPSASLSSINSEDSFYDAQSTASWAPPGEGPFPGSLSIAAPSVRAPYTTTTLEEDAVTLRKFIRDIVEASGTEGTPHQRAEAFRITLANHPEVLLWIIEEKDLLEIAIAADLPSPPQLQHPVIVAISDIHNGIQPILEAHKTFKSIMRSVKHGQKFYDTYTKEGLVTAVGIEAKDYVIKTLRKKGKKAFNELVNHLIRQQALIAYNKLTTNDLYQVLSLVPDFIFDEIANQIDYAITDTNISDSEEIRMLTDPTQGFDLSAVPPAFREFFENVLTQYFDKLPVIDKRRIAIGLLELAPGSSDEEKLAAILNNCGPAIQKLFQLFGEDVKSEQVSKVMTALKNQIKPFPTIEAMNIIEENLEGSISDLFSSFRLKPLAAATVGQVHLASLKETGEDVVIKVMRPGIRERAEREIALLMSLAPSEGTKKIVNRLESSLLEELDFTLEAKNMVAGEVYWNDQKGIYPIGLIEDFATTRDVLVMEKAYTKTIDQFHGADLSKKSNALGTFTEMWYDNAVFGDGFFHGDLHAGNIFLNPTNPDNGLPYGPDFQLTLIDFGACGRLSRREQQSIISFGLGAATNTPAVVVRALGDLCFMNPDQEERLLASTTEILGKDIKTSDACNEIINKAVELDLGLPKNFVLYNRGRAFLESQIRDTNAELNEFDPEGQVYQHDPEKIFRNLMVWRLGEDLVKRALLLKSSDDGKLDFSTVSKIVTEHLPEIEERDDLDYTYFMNE